MVYTGLAITFIGFLIAMMSPGLLSATGARLVLVLVGIAVSLYGILAVINPACQKNAVWKR